jgi:hypothetical protein
MLLLFVHAYILLLSSHMEEDVSMNYMTPKEAAMQWSVSERRIQLLCIQERVSGAVKFGRVWAIPIDTQKPIDLRKKAINRGRK